MFTNHNSFSSYVIIINLLLLVAGIFTTLYATEEVDIVVYGYHNCIDCQLFIDDLNRNGIDYTYYDLQNNASYKKDRVVDILRLHYQKDTFTFPIMEISGTILSRPTLHDVKERLNF